MQTFNLTQGSDAWKAHRQGRKNASDAPAVLGCSPYTTRSQLLHAMHTGIWPDPTAEQQRIFDRGHEIEAKKRGLAEQIIGEDLAPLVGSEVVDGIELSASFDGLTLMGDVNWECKTLNDDLRAALPNVGPDGNDAANLPKCYRVQMEQQCAVSGCKRVLFTASDGFDDDRHCWYYPDPYLRAEIIAAWRQFDEDLAAYQPVEVIPAAVADTIKELPALVVQVEGKVVSSNLVAFRDAATTFIANIKTDLQTDVDFANAEQTVKFCKQGEERLEIVKSQALAQTASIDELFRTVDEISGQLRSKRLELDKLVKARKESIKVEIVQAGKTAYNAHIEALKADTGGPWILLPPPDFVGKIKGLRTITSLRDAVDTELARAKIEANESAMKIKANLACLKEAGHEFLFSDKLALIAKPIDDLRLLIKARIAEHEQAEAKRLEAEREKIRQEEAAKLQREAEARDREQKALAEAEAKRVADLDRQQAQPAPFVTPAPAPTASVTHTATPTTATPLNMPQSAPKPRVARPSDDDIIDVISLHYRVHESKVLEWLLDMDLNAAGKRLAEQFAE